MAVLTDEEYVNELFTYHPPNPAQVKIYEKLRGEYKRIGKMILKYVPNSDQRTLALNALHISSMQANAGIALNPDKILPMVEEDGIIED